MQVLLLFLGETSTLGGCFCGFVFPGAPEGSTGRLIFSLVFLEKPGIEPAIPGLQGEWLNHCTREASKYCRSIPRTWGTQFSHSAAVIDCMLSLVRSLMFPIVK